MLERVMVGRSAVSLSCSCSSFCCSTPEEHDLTGPKLMNPSKRAGVVGGKTADRLADAHARGKIRQRS